MNDDYSTWTSCEFYGHLYTAGEENPGRHKCSDCGDEYEDPE